MRNHTMNILLVEDNPADASVVQYAFEENKVDHRMDVVEDGEEALDYLKRRGKYEKAPRPDMILLDLNLPRKDGREVLADVKRDPDLHDIPVVVWTSSEAEEDIRKSYDLHANCYVNKAMDLEESVDLVGSFKDFWMKRVRLPLERKT